MFVSIKGRKEALLNGPKKEKETLAVPLVAG